MVDHIKTILLPRFDTIGDLILLTPFLNILKEVFESAKIYLLVRKGYDQLAYLLPDWIQWISWDINPYLLPIKPFVLKDFIKGLKTEQWDLVLFTKYEHTWLEYLIAGFLRHNRRIVLSPMERYPEWILSYLNHVHMDPNFSTCELVPVEERIHEEDKYQILINYLSGDKKILTRPQISVPKAYQERSLELLQSIGLRSKEFCACLPGGIENIAIKRWPPEKFAKIIKWLKQKYNIDTLLIGHEKEHKIIEDVVNQLQKRNGKPFIWLGKNGEIPLLAGLLEQAKFYFGNDSGPMHMSGALGIPVVALFGGGTWPRFIPKGSECHVIVRTMPCFYCDWKCSFGDAPCIKDLPLPLVKEVLKIIMEGEGLNKNGVTVHEARQYSKVTQKFIGKAGEAFRVSERDREARLRVIYRCEFQIQEISQDREVRLRELEELGRRLRESESERLVQIERIRGFEQQIQEISQDREVRLRELEELGRRLRESESERLVQIERIRGFEQQIQEMRRGEEVRLRELEELGRRLRESESERLVQIERIRGFEQQIQEMRRGEEVRLRELEELGRRLRESESERLVQIERIRGFEQQMEEQIKLIEVQRAELIKSSLIWKMSGFFNRPLKK